MNKHYLLFLAALCISIFLVSCSNDDNNEWKTAVHEDSARLVKEDNIEAGETVEKTYYLDKNGSNQKVIYEAELDVYVKEITKTEEQIKKYLAEHGGYIVHSNVHKEENQPLSGYYTIRIPSKKLDELIKQVENVAIQIERKMVSGQDVTEEFVDLQSRLTSKKTVEKRLLEFMNNADNTEDLLKISNDLAKVQEEIETIQGRMKYLKDRVDLATLSIAMHESTGDKIVHEELNTWEKTKRQFISSINTVLQLLSTVVVIVVGHLPLIIVVGGFIFIISFIFWKKYRTPKNNE